MHPRIESLMHLGALYHPFHETAEKQVDGVYIGGFIIKGGLKIGRKPMKLIKTLAFASIPHATYSDDELKKSDFREGITRLSVGFEVPDALIRNRALSQI